MRRRPRNINVYLVGKKSQLCERLQKNLADTSYEVDQVVRELNELDKLDIQASAGQHSFVILIDCESPDDMTLERCREVKARNPNAKFVVVSPNDDALRIIDWVRAGADAFLHVADLEKLLIPTLKLVTDGMLIMPNVVMNFLENRTLSDQMVSRSEVESD